MAQSINPKIATDGLVFSLDTLGGRGPNKIITKPTAIDNCILWLDADDYGSIIEDDDHLVSNWLDKSGEGNHAAQGTPANRASYRGVGRISSKAMVSFDGTNDHMDIAGLSGTTFGSNGGVTIFMVARQPVFDNTGAGFYFGGQSGDPTTQNYMGCGTSGGNSMDFRMYGGSGTGAEVATFYGDTDGYNIHVGLWSKHAAFGFGSAAVSIYFNGKQGGSTTSSVTSSNWTTDEAAKIGESATGAYTKIDISEIILFNRNLTTDERGQVELYLSRKWNITLQTQQREQTSPNNIQNSTIPISGFKNGKLDQVGNSIYFMGGPNTTGGYKDWINVGPVLPGNTSDSYSTGNPFTYEVWASSKSPTRDGSNWKTILGGSNLVQLHFYGSNTISFRKNGGNPGGDQQCRYDSMNLHEWYHIVGTYAGGISHNFSGNISTGPDLRKLYVNGVLAEADKECVRANLNSNYIGSYHSNGLERGPMELAVARIYNRELSHEQIKQNYNAQKARIDAIPKIPKPANLQLYLDAGIWESYKGHGSGNTVVDLSGQGNNGGFTNGTAYDTILPENDMGKSFVFDGSDDYIEVADAAELDITGDMTISCWVKMGSSENGNFCVFVNKRYNSDTTNPFMLFFDDRGSDGVVNKFGFIMGAGTGSGTNIGDVNSFDGIYGKWDHVVATVSGTTQSLYVNGVLSGTGTFSGSRQTNNYSIKIGGPYTHGGANYMLGGNISVVMIQNTALSAKEVVQLYDYHKHRYGK